MVASFVAIVAVAVFAIPTGIIGSEFQAMIDERRKERKLVAVRGVKLPLFTRMSIVCIRRKITRTPTLEHRNPLHRMRRRMRMFREPSSDLQHISC